MDKYQVQLSGLSNGIICSSFVTVKAENEVSAKEKAIKQTKLKNPSVYQALKLRKHYAKNLPF